MAEKVKIAAGSAYPLDEEIKVVIRGRDMLTGLPKAVEVSSVEIREGIAGNFCRCTGYQHIVNAIQHAAGQR